MLDLRLQFLVEVAVHRRVGRQLVVADELLEGREHGDAALVGAVVEPGRVAEPERLDGGVRVRVRRRLLLRRRLEVREHARVLRRGGFRGVLRGGLLAAAALGRRGPRGLLRVAALLRLGRVALGRGLGRALLLLQLAPLGLRELLLLLVALGRARLRLALLLLLLLRRGGGLGRRRRLRRRGHVFFFTGMCVCWSCAVLRSS
mmetsp:Transcript_29681/g.98246  ORF Transcript_29681/g.98246 Transcript_29681/m.98246 type:complete len:203 (-) Transcript_29681:71-679(-)